MQIACFFVTLKQKSIKTNNAKPCTKAYNRLNMRESSFVITCDPEWGGIIRVD